MKTNRDGFPTSTRGSRFSPAIRLTRSILILLTTLLPGWARAQETVLTIADGTFDPSNWAITIAWEFSGGTSASFQQYADGGNPGQYGGISLRSFAPNAVAVMWQGFTYNPAVQGEIVSITSSADVRLLRNSSGDAFLPYRPLISQNGNFFYGNSAMGVDSAAWTPFAFGSQVLTASRFIGVGNANSLRPDFSGSGAPIQFGFMVDHGTLFSGRDSELGVDNWQMNITSVPEPGVGALTLFTLALWTLNQCWSYRRSSNRS